MAALVTGAAGFVGSFLVERLIGNGTFVVGADNLSHGTKTHLSRALESGKFRLVEVDLSDRASISQRLEPVVVECGVDMVWHLAANSDIKAGITDPTVDLRDTLLTTFNMVTLARSHEIVRFAFASTSAIYGEARSPLNENSGLSLPTKRAAKSAADAKSLDSVARRRSRMIASTFFPAKPRRVVSNS